MLVPSLLFKECVLLKCVFLTVSLGRIYNEASKLTKCLRVSRPIKMWETRYIVTNLLLAK